MIDCPCSGKHVPKPLTSVKVGNHDLCPTAYANLNDLVHKYQLTGRRPDGSVTKHYGKFIRELAHQMWEDSL